MDKPQKEYNIVITFKKDESIHQVESMVHASKLMQAIRFAKKKVNVPNRSIIEIRVTDIYNLVKLY